MTSPNLALIMLKSDAVRQRLTGSVLDWLAARGFTPTRFRELMLVPELRDQLYDNSRVGGRLDWYLNEMLYTHAPVHAILLEHPGERDAPKWLSGELKGRFLPNLAEPGTIRHDLGALNPICNLAHAADDGTRVRHEARVLFGDNQTEDEESLKDLAIIAKQPASPAPLWPTVRRVLDDLGCPTADDDWPNPAEGPTTHACLRVRALVRRLAGAGGELVAGAQRGEVPISSWPAATRRSSPWDLYLTYTTLRYLDLCLESVDV